MGQHYSHWTLDQRFRLCGLLEMGLGLDEIARRLNRHRSTVYREMGATAASWAATDRRVPTTAPGRAKRGSRIGRSTPLRNRVKTGLAMGWSPEQIVGRMEREAAEHRIGVESIYRYVWSLEGRKAGLPAPPAQAAAGPGPAARVAAADPEPGSDPGAAGKCQSSQRDRTLGRAT